MLLSQIQDFLDEYLGLLCMLLPVKPNSRKPHLANGISTFFINSNPVFVIDLKSLPGIPTGCTFFSF